MGKKLYTRTHHYNGIKLNLLMSIATCGVIAYKIYTENTDTRVWCTYVSQYLIPSLHSSKKYLLWDNLSCHGSQVRNKKNSGKRTNVLKKCYINENFNFSKLAIRSDGAQKKCFYF